ncbi:MAG: hypothetical protein DRN17_05535 [Thermoplasmata archaeon]|nr:MAG: hypothetical protein DRN17_05535 [Thermoplasmata archaeon]
MPYYFFYLIAMAVGAFAGFLHQIIDTQQKNDTKSIVRAVIVGAAAGLLVYAINPVEELNTLILLSFTAGWSGDSIILNIVRRLR